MTEQQPKPYVNIFFTCLLIISLLAVGHSCISSKKAPLEFPEAMLPEVKADYQKVCERGYALYKLSCAKCHSSKKWGREVIPDFKEEQLTGYALRISNARHESNLPDSLVSELDLADIMMFLRYKKKNR